MISLRMTLPVPLLLLILTPGVVTVDNWGVFYTPSSICALKGSTVTMSCRYKYPSDYRVKTGFWSTELVTDVGDPPDLASDPAYRNRIQYIGDKENDCTLKLHDVSEQDQRTYYFRFITDKPGAVYQGGAGVLLSVTETISVEVPENVVAGTVVTLTCKTTCTPTDHTFTWYKNGQKLNHYSKSLYPQSVSREKAGSYSCAVGDLQSPAVILNVQYPPERVSVSISLSGEIMEGSSVTLTCSTDANPPVTDDMYTWFKRENDGTNSFKETGRIYTIKKISFEDSGEYYCKATNKHGSQSSITVNLNVWFSASISPSDEIMEGSSVTLTCSTDANPPVTDAKYTWFKRKNNGTRSITETERIYTIINISSEDRGEYYCRAGKNYGYRRSITVNLNVLYPPKTVRVSISPSGEKVEGSLETLACSSDANPPVQSYTWFKEGGDSPVGSGQSYNVLQAGSYYCVAQNKYGNQTAAAFSVTSNDILGDESTVLYAVLGVVAVCLIAIIVGLIIWRRGNSADEAKPDQENVCSNVETRPSTNNQTSNHDEVEYVCVLNQAPNKPRKVKSSPVKASGSGSTDEFLYATVLPHDDRVAGKPQEDDPQYSSIMFTHSGAASSSAALRAEDCSVIYSSVK